MLIRSENVFKRTSYLHALSRDPHVILTIEKNYNGITIKFSVLRLSSNTSWTQSDTFDVLSQRANYTTLLVPIFLFFLFQKMQIHIYMYKFLGKFL